MNVVLGRHYLIDFSNCEASVLTSVKEIECIMKTASDVGRLNVVQHCFHQFKPYGVSGVMVLAESHFTIHTWSEHSFASVDLYLCDGTIEVQSIIDCLSKLFETDQYEIRRIDRGIKEGLVIS